jgi:flagellar basal-body rod protein FlgB
MFNDTPTIEALTRAIDVSALRQSVYAANIANANAEGYRRMEVSFDREMERVALQMGAMSGSSMSGSLAGSESATIVSTDAAVKLDEEMGLMAKNALRYQTLLSAFEKTLGLTRMAIREGR